MVTKRYLREYPRGTLAAHLFGSVSEITEPQLALKRNAGVEPGTRIGQSGLEYTYDKFLRGEDGTMRLTVDAHGARDEQRRLAVTRPSRAPAAAHARRRPAGGGRAGARAGVPQLRGTRPRRRVPGDGSHQRRGARDGSAPPFDASVFARPFTQRTWESLTSDATDAPLVNRATESVYPSASTFKPVTALAALEAGLITPSRTIEDRGTWEYGGRDWQNARGARFGDINVSTALKVSSDIFFFKLGAQAYEKGPLIQRWAERLGYGHKTGIDLPGEKPGLVPDRRWRKAGFAEYLECAEKEHVVRGTMDALFKCGGIDKPWTGGDNVNLAVGQGDLQATPIQVAVAYAALANGGTIVRPHLGKAIEDANGIPLQEFRPKARRQIELAARDRAVILEGLRARRAGGARHVRRCVEGLADAALPGLRQDRHGRARRRTRPGLVRLLRQGLRTADRRRGDGGEGRLRRGDGGARGADDPLRMVRREGSSVPYRFQRDPVKPRTLAANARRNANGGVRRMWRWRATRAAAWALLERHVAPGATVAVVGAGNGHDLPLRRLGRRAGRLDLIDLDPRRAARHPPPAAPHRRARHRDHPGRDGRRRRADHPRRHRAAAGARAPGAADDRRAAVRRRDRRPVLQPAPVPGAVGLAAAREGGERGAARSRPRRSRTRSWPGWSRRRPVGW